LTSTKGVGSKGVGFQGRWVARAVGFKGVGSMGNGPQMNTGSLSLSCLSFRKGRLLMSDPVIFQKAPMPVDVEEGKTYFWCACGKSAKQPFCDGSHKDTGIAPVKMTADASKKVFFCGCKYSAKAPLCDGSHNKLD
jgi:CDGSH-type Zn-finger protein